MQTLGLLVQALENKVTQLTSRLDTGPTIECQDLSTSLQPSSDAPVMFLDRHDVSCPENYFLSKFHLVRGGSHDDSPVRYIYKCCKAKF